VCKKGELELGETVNEEGTTVETAGKTSVCKKGELELGETVNEEGTTVETVGDTTVFWRSRAKAVATERPSTKTRKRMRYCIFRMP
jgi:hypothetical protein